MHCRAKAKRLISRPAVIFKGSGFYSTDNKRSSSALDNAPSTPLADSSGNGHGHSHSDGGHSHDSGSSETKAPAAVD
jgi:hypothetical protein